MDLDSWMRERRELVESVLLDTVADGFPKPFDGALKYPLQTGGKRIRPILTLAAFELCAPTADRRCALPAALAVELIHTYSLVHDDLPAMDDDDERRGKPTVHRAYDVATAILVGDALLTQAFQLLTDAEAGSDAVRIRLISELAQAAGYRGMVGGQAMDILGGREVTDLNELTTLHRCKTGALIRAAVRMGAIAAEADANMLAALTTYAECAGLAFQLADDVLDADEDEESDSAPSFVRLLGVQGTQQKAESLIRNAKDALREIDGTEGLYALADFIVTRGE